MARMNKIKTLCVYCGSGPGTNPRFIEAAIALGRALADNGIRLVYGGGSMRLMGAVATSALDHGGTVTGIIPDFLKAKENALAHVQEMIVTPDMHERKRLMFERSDAFVALPGGIGTLEELVEQLTWQQLGRHSTQILLANIDNFWEPLLALLAHMRATQFIRATLAVDILKAERVEDILPRLRSAAARAPAGAGDRAPALALVGWVELLRYPSSSLRRLMGFARALPILRITLPETSPPRSDCHRDRSRTPRNSARDHADAGRARRPSAHPPPAQRHETRRPRRLFSPEDRCGRRCPARPAPSRYAD